MTSPPILLLLARIGRASDEVAANVAAAERYFGVGQLIGLGLVLYGAWIGIRFVWRFVFADPVRK